MNVLEIKNNLVKIAYNAEDNLALSGFVIIEDVNNPYVAQVMSIKADGVKNFAIVKLLFTFDEEGILKNYNGTIPSTDAKVSMLPAKELLDIIPADNPLRLGTIAQQETPLKIDMDILSNNLLICSNNLNNTQTLLKNIVAQLSNKSIIIDSEGTLSGDNKVVFGEDFKLPLNYETIDYIYENDLNDVDAINKAIIQDVFIEVQNYIKTLPEKFLPFDTFVNVVDSQYRETQIPELVLLKNKLVKYKEMSVFAQDLKEILNLSISIEQNESLIIDISNISDNLQKEVIRYIYTVLEEQNSKMYVFAKVNNYNITKKLLKTFISKDKSIYTTVICPHEFKYIEEIKELSQNIIFFQPSTLTHDFASYNTYLNKLNSNEFIIYGAHTQNIPFIVEVDDSVDFDNEPPVDDDTEKSTVETFEDDDLSNDESFSEEEVIDDSTEENSSEEEVIDIVEENEVEEADVYDDNYAISEEIPSDYNNNIENIVNEETQDDEPLVEILDNTDSEKENPNEEFEDNIIDDEVKKNSKIEEIEENSIENGDFEILDRNADIQNESDNTEEEEEEEEEEIDKDILAEQIAKDVDKVFYEKLPEDNDFDNSYIDNNSDNESEEIIQDELNVENTENESDDNLEIIEEDSVIENTEENIPDNNLSGDDLTEDDLNLIDDLEDIPLAGEIEDSTIPEEDEDLAPVVPIYDADDIEEQEGLYFEPGDRVSTAKYGEGVVEKMIKYGNKMLCSIEFPNIGRRLLNPSMTEITRIG